MSSYVLCLDVGIRTNGVGIGSVISSGETPYGGVKLNHAMAFLK